MFYYPRVMGLQEQEICIDPKYQREGQDADKEGTYYPQGVVCYTDPSEGKKIQVNSNIVKLHSLFFWVEDFISCNNVV